MFDRRSGTFLSLLLLEAGAVGQMRKPRQAKRGLVDLCEFLKEAIGEPLGTLVEVAASRGILRRSWPVTSTT